MKKQGISGVLMFNARGGPTPKTTEFMSQERRDLFRFAVEEASKRGIEVSLNLCSGWDAGGPWIAAEEAPQTLVFTAHQIKGPQRLAARLSEPKHDDSYYQDIVVLAYRVLAEEYQPVADADYLDDPSVRAISSAGSFVPTRLHVPRRPAQPSRPSWIFQHRHAPDGQIRAKFLERSAQNRRPGLLS
jgi:hypothetical protein